MHKSRWIQRSSTSVLHKCLLLESLGQRNLFVMDLMSQILLMWRTHLIKLVLNISNRLKVQIINAGQLLLHQIHLVAILTNFGRRIILKVHDGVTGRVVAINYDLLVFRLLNNLQLSLVLVLSECVLGDQLLRIHFWVWRGWLLFIIFRWIHLVLSLRSVCKIKSKDQFWWTALLFLFLSRRSSVRRRLRGWIATTRITITRWQLWTAWVISVFESSFSTLLSFNFHDFVVEPLILKLFDLFLRKFRHLLLFLKFNVLLFDIFNNLLLNLFGEGHIVVLANLINSGF